MSDYINREEAEKIFVEYNCVKYHVTEIGDTNEANRIMLMFRENAKKLFSLAPSADVVEVIRCKDCKWFNRFGCAVEIVDFTDRPTENDYCSFGERKDDE